MSRAAAAGLGSTTAPRQHPAAGARDANAASKTVARVAEAEGRGWTVIQLALPFACIEVRTRSHGFARFLRRRCRHVCVADPRAADVTAEVACLPLKRWPPPLPTGAVAPGESPPAGVFQSFSQGKDLYVWEPGAIAAAMEGAPAKQLRIWLGGACPDAWARLVAQRGSTMERNGSGLPRILNYGKALDLLLCLAGRLCGVAVLHGAVLARNGGAVFLAGESGSGKTTASLALHRSGFRILSDEYAILWTAGRRQGLVSGVLVPPMLACSSPRTLEELERSLGQPTASGKREFHLAHPPTSKRAVRIRLLIVLAASKRRPKEHRAEPIPPTDAFRRLASQLLDPIRRDRAATMSVLADLAATVPAYQVTTGRNLPGLAEFLRNLMPGSRTSMT
jgi:hypothetical protein